MIQAAGSSISLGSFIAYGLLILLYLIILRLLLNLLQQMGDKHLTQRSVVDRDIRRVMSSRVESSMQAFDIYSISIVIAKGGIASLGMAAIIVMLVMKVGLLATGVLVVIVVTALYGIDHWLKSREKPESVRAELRRNLHKAGSMGTIVMLSIALAVLLFVMAIMNV